jgi:hypothetical protein
VKPPTLTLDVASTSTDHGHATTMGQSPLVKPVQKNGVVFTLNEVDRIHGDEVAVDQLHLVKARIEVVDLALGVGNATRLG